MQSCVLIDSKLLLETSANALARSIPLLCTSLHWEKLVKMTAQEIMGNYSAQPEFPESPEFPNAFSCQEKSHP